MTESKNKFIDGLLLVIAIIFYSPLNINLAVVANKPVDMVYSDIVVLVLVLMYLPMLVFSKIERLDLQLLFLVASGMFFFLVLAMIGYIETGSLTPILSAIKYEKVFLALLAGMCLSKWWSIERFWRISTTAILIIVFSLCYSQFVQINSFSPRWGAELFGMPVYGYPNSSASYLLMYVSFLCVAILRGRNSNLFRIGLVFSMLFMLMSLSRSAFVVLMVFLILMSFKLVPFRSLLKFSAIIVVSGMLFVTIFTSTDSYKSTVSAFETRWARTFYAEDGTSGRLDIAIESIDLIAKRVVTGYHFDSFSNFHDGHSTPHNQYLEAMFKTGFLGLLVYFFVFFIFVWVVLLRAKSSTSSYINRISVTCFMFALTALLIGNITQPNFTYSQTGNVIFLVLGFLSRAQSKKAKTRLGLARNSLKVI